MYGSGITNTANPRNFYHFIDNSTATFLSSGSNGYIFMLRLNPGIDTVYRNTYPTTFDTMITTIIIKVVVMYTEAQLALGPQQGYVRIQGRPLNIASRDDFFEEIDIQNQVYMQSTFKLVPICPGLIHSDVNFDLNTIHADARSQGILDAIMQLRGVTAGVIGMEFAEGYQTLYDFTRHNGINDYAVAITAFLLLRLANETGYAHGDFHVSNVMFDGTSRGYFNGIIGRPLLLDYGYATVIPRDVLIQIIQLMDSHNYVDALMLQCTVPRGQHRLDEYAMFRYICRPRNDTEKRALNDLIVHLFEAYNEAINIRRLDPLAPPLPRNTNSFYSRLSRVPHARISNIGTRKLKPSRTGTIDSRRRNVKTKQKRDKASLIASKRLTRQTTGKRQ